MPHLLILLLIFWIMVFCTFSLESFLTARIAAAFPQITVSGYLVILLFRTNITTAAVLLICLLSERRPLRTLGMTARHLLRDYALGALLGLLMFGAVMLTGWAGGAFSYQGTGQITGKPLYALLTAGWVMQGFSEEIAFRGWLMMSAGMHIPPQWAVTVSSLCFAAAHLGNDGVSVIAFCNLLLFGAVMSLLMFRTDSIWAPAALHSAWNWAQGSFFGLPVSGIPTADTVLSFAQTGRAEWLGGGTFGPESGLAAAGVLLLTLLMLFWIPQTNWRDKNESI